MSGLLISKSQKSKGNGQRQRLLHVLVRRQPSTGRAKAGSVKPNLIAYTRSSPELGCVGDDEALWRSGRHGSPDRARRLAGSASAGSPPRGLCAVGCFSRSERHAVWNALAARSGHRNRDSRPPTQPSPVTPEYVHCEGSATIWMSAARSLSASPRATMSSRCLRTTIAAGSC
jgi:hypothetical protein